MSKKFNKVGVLKGGPSDEREVSLRSGAAVAGGLRRAGYEVVEIDVVDRTLDLPAGLEAVFVALHGEFGEDGTVQSMLREKGVFYTGSGPESSRISFDKLLSKNIFLEHGIPTPRFEVLTAEKQRTLPLPVVVKPVRGGSSIGVTIVLHESEWYAAFQTALANDGEAMVETYIPGSELTVGIVVDQVLPVIEIRAPAGFYNYRAKYTSGVTQYLVPAPITEEQARRCGELAGKTFKALGSRDLGRVDIRMSPEGELFVLELNSIPGFTETSLLPKAARAVGIEFPQLCDRIMREASVH